MLGALLLAFACVVLGYGAAQEAAERKAAATHQQLRAALDRNRDAFVENAAPPPAVIAEIGRTAGLRAVRFDGEPAPGGGTQSVFDSSGRIVGWLSWEADRPLADVLAWLWPILAGVFGAAAIFGLSAAWRLRRSVRSLADSNAEARKIANEDMLTGLPHRRAMLALLENALAARKPHEVVALAFLNVDGFKEVNDIHGHETGDQLLAALAERLKAIKPETALAGRVGADEFAVIVNSNDEGSATAAIGRVAAELAKPYWIGGRTFAVAVSGGYAFAPGDGSTRDEMTTRANLALRAAKRNGRGKIVAFAAGMKSEAADRRFIERELKRALANGALELYYQPIVAANGSGMVGVEALLRWNHPERGQIAPPDFVPIAEQTGLMGELGEFVLRRALADAQRWPDLFIAVNLSPVQVRDRALVDVVSRALAASGTEPARLLLEITEGVLIDNPEEARERLDALRALGIRLALDDFGTGFSSLSYLQRFPFDKLKVDKSFVAPLGTSANAGAMIQAIVALGRALGLSVLVEGVETEEQRVLLRLAGCDEMQGFRFARPAPPDRIDLMRATGKLQAVGGRRGLRSGIAAT